MASLAIFFGLVAARVVSKNITRKSIGAAKIADADNVKCEVMYTGNCHCKSIQFTVKAPKHLVVWDCNCSVCYMKNNWHFIVPERCFTLTSGADNLTEYTFNTRTAKHMFCKHCGVQAFYRPRSNPDGSVVFIFILFFTLKSCMHGFLLLFFTLQP